MSIRAMRRWRLRSFDGAPMEIPEVKTPFSPSADEVKESMAWGPRGSAVYKMRKKLHVVA